MSQHECLDGPEGCHGPVEPRSLDGLKWWPRCEAHWDRRLERYEGSIEQEAQSPLPPAWFDPTAAGERWDED
jgi:hypothetical protein